VGFDFNFYGPDISNISSYAISLLANLNARGESNTVIKMNDITTPHITLGSHPRQRTGGVDGGDGYPMDPGSSVVNNTVQQEILAVEAAENVTIESRRASTERGMSGTLTQV
jgi:hypothetical protein